MLTKQFRQFEQWADENDKRKALKNEKEIEFQNLKNKMEQKWNEFKTENPEWVSAFSKAWEEFKEEAGENEPIKK